MSKPENISRPPFAEALNSWKQFLQQRKLPADLIWVFDENLCFEKDPAQSSGFRLGFQTAFTPPPPEAEQVAYEYFREFHATIVFFRLGSSRGRSVCVLLCDPWFKRKTEAEGFSSQPPWGLLFRPGDAAEVEEIVDRARWENRIVRERPLHDLDFTMELRGVHEILAHGRVLTTYEHYALKLLHLWGQVFEHK